MRRDHLLATAALAAVVAVSSAPPVAVAQQQHMQTTTTESSASPSGVMPADLDFVLKAASGGMEEVALGNLATQKAAGAQTKQLASMIVQEHTVANEELMAIAGRKQIQIPQTTSPASQTVAASMSELNGQKFDMAYVMQQHGAHLATIALFEHASMHAADSDVKAYAQKYLPKIKAHTADIEKAVKAMM
jgi:putative membrane protein